MNARLTTNRRRLPFPDRPLRRPAVPALLLLACWMLSGPGSGTAGYAFAQGAPESAGSTAATDSAAASGVAIEQVRVGFEGMFKFGVWTPVDVELTSRSDRTVRLLLESTDPDGARVTFPMPEVELTQDGRQTLSGLFQCGREDAPLRVIIQDTSEPGTVLATTTLRAARSPDDSPLTGLEHSVRLIATLGDPAGFPTEKSGTSSSTTDAQQYAFDADVEVARLKSAGQLPQDPDGYAGLDVLALAGQYDLDTKRSQALRQWIHRGGNLVLSVASGLAEFQQSPLSEWLQQEEILELEESPVRLRELTSLESFSESSERILFQGRVKAAKISRSSAGDILVEGHDGPLIVQFPYGFGKITFVGLDLERPPLSSWPALPKVVATIIGEETLSERQEDHSGERGRLTHSGITDLATQLHAVQEHFPEVPRASNWGVMGLLLLFVAVIGPLDYLLMHRLLGRPHLTWITFPLVSILAAVLLARTAASDNGSTVRVNRTEMIDIDVGTGDGLQSARVHSWSTIYSPESRRYRAAVESLLEGTADSDGNPETGTAAAESAATGMGRPSRPRIRWEGIPESTFGGMYRGGGFDLGRPAWSFGADARSIENLPIAIWSTRSLVSSWDAQVAPVVEADLHSTGAGQLSGSLRHSFPVPLRNWMVAYGNRVFLPVVIGNRAATDELAPGEIWRPDGAGVRQRELNGYLTQTVAVRVQRREAHQPEIESRKTRYDASSRDAEYVARMLTFYQAAGGESYTGLSSAALSDLDLTGLLRLNRAVLFAEADLPASRLMLNDQPVEPSRQRTFVRIVLPVATVDRDDRLGE